MSTRVGVFLAAVSCVLALGPSWPGDAAPLQPTKAWLLDHGETQCLASRPFGAGDELWTFAIRPSPIGETFDLIATRRGFAPKVTEELRGSVDFGYGPIMTWLLRFGSREPDMEILQYRLTAAQMAQAKTATSVKLKTSNGLVSSDIEFSLRNMPALLDGLEKCTENLRRHWNITDDVERDVTPAAGDIRGLFSALDYPEEALRRDQSGRVQYLLLIDETGKVAACHVVVPSGIPVLDVRGCQVVRERAKFTPARDAQGKARRDDYITPFVTWRLVK